MAAYEYDEAGTMALYFLITFLALLLVPFTLSSIFAGGGEYFSQVTVDGLVYREL
jgi:translocation protein SEC63